MKVSFVDPLQCEISGHYSLEGWRKPHLDLYFQRISRVRCITFRNEQGEARLVFQTGVC